MGETLYWASATLFQRIGAHIIAVLLLVAGLLLLSRSTIAGMIRTTMRAGGRARDGAKDLRDRRAGDGCQGASDARRRGTRLRDGPDEGGVDRADRRELLGPEPDDEVEGERARSLSPSRRRTATASPRR